jgi:hypothetical protein
MPTPTSCPTYTRRRHDLVASSSLRAQVPSRNIIELVHALDVLERDRLLTTLQVHMAITLRVKDKLVTCALRTSSCRALLCLSHT